MKVYRLENSLGEGPFAGRQETVLMLSYHADPEQLIPTVGHKLMKKMFSENYVFGWSTPELMYQFVKGKTPADRKRNWQLVKKTYGFAVVEYDTNGIHVVLSDGQVMFKKNSTESDKSLCRKMNSLIEEQRHRTLTCDR